MFTGELGIKFNKLVQMIVAPTQGLSRLFTVKEGGIFAANKVQYDIMQEAERMALPRKRGDSANINTGSTFQSVTEEVSGSNMRQSQFGGYYSRLCSFAGTGGTQKNKIQIF